MPASSPSEAPTAELQPVVVRSAREQCVACGAPLASDQRYCVECGQRLGRARLPFMDDRARHGASTQPPRPQRVRMSANTTLIAGIGTLMLAMGVGVLIGRSAPGSAARSAGPVQVLTVPSAAAGAASPQSTQPSTTSTPTKSSSTPGGSKSGGPGSKPPAKAHLPPAKVVTVGSPGKGPGYQKGHFTGNFFGEGEG
jgi:hypothetical protein